MPTIVTLIRKNKMPKSVNSPPSSGPMTRRRPARISTSTKLPAEHASANIVNTCNGAMEKPVMRSKFSRTSLANE